MATMAAGTVVIGASPRRRRHSGGAGGGPLAGHAGARPDADADPVPGFGVGGHDHGAQTGSDRR